MVADNGSTDKSLAFLKEHYPELKTIVLDRNYGFAGGYNKALSQLEYEYVVLLNSDVEVTKGWFRSAIDYLDTNSEVAALQPKIRAYNARSCFEYAGAAGGYMDIYGYPYCRGRIFNTIEEDSGQYDTVREVFWTSGACMFIRLKEFTEAGRFDEQFFAHQEEIDLCWRLNARGKRLVCLPQSVVYHVGGATLDQSNPRKTYLNFRNNLLMLHKNLPDPYYRRIMTCRFFLDYLAALQFLVSGQYGNAKAIRTARHDFCKLKKQYTQIRNGNLQQTTVPLSPTLLTRSLLWEYYCSGKKKYSQFR